MDRPKNGIQIQSRQGKPVQAGAFQLTPETQSVSVHFPFGGFVYQRPVAVLVEREGALERIPILDITRLVLIGLAGFTIFFTFVLSIQASRMRRK